MSTNDLTVTLVGWVGTEPKHYTGASTTPFTSFRMANTRRYFDRGQNVWADGRTEWFTVKVWRQSALNVAASLRKGDPVLVHGRLSTEQWESPEGPRTSLVLEALAIGPDLTYGRATFARTVHVGAGGAAAPTPSDAEGGAASSIADDDPWASDGLGGALDPAGVDPDAVAAVGDDRDADGADGADGDSDGDGAAQGADAVRELDRV
jgi:single-strand DNA-binding protein